MIVYVVHGDVYGVGATHGACRALLLNPSLCTRLFSPAALQERKKMKRGGGEDAASAPADALGGTHGADAAGFLDSSGVDIGMTPGRVVVDEGDQLVRFHEKRLAHL